jgi:NACHT domain
MSQLVQGQEDILETLNRMQQSARNDNANLGESVAPETAMNRDQVQRTMWDLLKSNSALPHWAAGTSPGSSNQSMKEQDHQLCRKIVQSLYFENLNYRGGTIPEAHAKTCKWIFQEPQLNDEQVPAWSSFPNWLEGNSTDIYWITGKPGAGKSTLVKFILGNHKMEQCLQKWLVGSPLLILGYYFWIAGSEIHRSREGLLRAMLFQALDSKPHLVPKVLLARWTMLRLFGDRFPQPRWEIEELLDIFRRLVAEVTKEGKLVLVIDGLDEFQGNHTHSINLIHEIGTWRRLKICVSSRPEYIFRDAFIHSPSLQVENLTRGDINLYVRDHFGKSQGFRDLRAIYGNDVNCLITGVVDKAKGVFLWVKVVVADLLEGFTNGDSLPKLQATLDELPDDLSELFQAIWDRIDSQFYKEASHLFQILESAARFPSGLSAFVLWLSDDDCHITMSSKDVISINQTAIVVSLKRKLSSRTRGLLEIHNNERVDYMHRTVRDWVVKLERQLQSFSSPDYDPYLMLLKGKTLQIASYPTTSLSSDTHFWEIVSYLFGYASYVKDIESNRPLFISTLDRIDVELTRLSLAKDKHGYYALYSQEFSPTSHKHLPHWSTLQTRGNSGLTITSAFDTPPTNYIGFISQIPLAPYVREKILTKSSLLFPNSPILDPVEAVSFQVGFTNCFIAGRPLYFDMCLKSDEERLELLRFMLAQGADSTRLKVRLNDDRKRWSPKSESWRNKLLQIVKEEEVELKKRSGLPHRLARRFKVGISRFK